MQLCTLITATRSLQKSIQPLQSLRRILCKCLQDIRQGQSTYSAGKGRAQLESDNAPLPPSAGFLRLCSTPLKSPCTTSAYGCAAVMRRCALTDTAMRPAGGSCSRICIAPCHLISEFAGSFQLEHHDWVLRYAQAVPVTHCCTPCLPPSLRARMLSTKCCSVDALWRAQCAPARHC